MKLGAVGKGGTDKTTLSTVVALVYVGRGKRWWPSTPTPIRTWP